MWKDYYSIIKVYPGKNEINFLLDFEETKGRKVLKARVVRGKVRWKMPPSRGRKKRASAGGGCRNVEPDGCCVDEDQEKIRRAFKDMCKFEDWNCVKREIQELATVDIVGCLKNLCKQKIKWELYCFYDYNGKENPCKEEEQLARYLTPCKERSYPPSDTISICPRTLCSSDYFSLLDSILFHELVHKCSLVYCHGGKKEKARLEAIAYCSEKCYIRNRGIRKPRYAVEREDKCRFYREVYKNPKKF